jgi:hypothetical protein
VGGDFNFTPQITIGYGETPPGATVSGVAPNSGPATGGTAVTITGTGFVAGSTVAIGQGNGVGPGSGAISATNVMVVSPTEITATTGGGAKAGTWNVIVSTPAGHTPASSADQFTYTRR